MWILRPRGLIHGLESATSFPGLNKVRLQQFFIRQCFILTLCPRYYLFVLIFQSANAENMRNVTKMEIANARKATSRNKRNANGLKVCVSLITVVLLRTATSLRTATFLADGTTAISLQQPLSSIPKVAVKEGFNCNCNITSENTVRFLHSLFCFLKGLHFTSFSHPSHKNHQGSFHLSPSLVNIHFFPSAFQDQE